MQPDQEKRVSEPDGRRHLDRERKLLVGTLGGALALCCLASLVSVVISFTTLTNRVTIDQFRRESHERVNQRCVQDERAQAEVVERLRGTYAYLVTLTPAQKREPLNAFILRSLPNLERDARVTQAPAFCDEPGVGLPEPGPEIPRRPDGL